MNYFWLQSPDEVCEVLKTDCRTGLSRDEAQKRLLVHGPNKISDHKTFSALRLFIKQFRSIVVAILGFAVVISLAIGQWLDASLISAIIVLNAIIGFAQEYAAEKSLIALQKFTQPKARVLRDTSELIIDAVQVVPGDIVVLAAGELIPADGRLYLCHDLEIDESALTGESVPVEKNDHQLPKNVPLADRTNMAYLGTMCVKGSGRMIVTQTGNMTELGHIASFIKTAHAPEMITQKRMRQISYVLVSASLCISAALFIIGLLLHTSWVVVLLMALSVAVAAIPEGLPVVITVGLARSVTQMAKRNALIRRLAAVETLGTVSVICSDKTGTITQNRMTVTCIALPEGYIGVRTTGQSPEDFFCRGGTALQPDDDALLMKALEIAVLCNDASLHKENNTWQIVGDPTEGALLIAATKAHLYKNELERRFALITSNAFDSNRKRMSMVRKTDDGTTLYVKGAYDSILTVTAFICKGGSIVPITEEDKTHIHEMHDHLARQALRVLAVAYKENDDKEDNLIFVGLMGMIDPPRPEVVEAIRSARSAGIRTIMITGDHPETARAIARMVGLLDEEKNEILTGIDLDALSDPALSKKLPDTAVFARITVEHKIRIVQVLQAQGEIVAVTGDGVNDAPAVKTADIGIAMGITGTDVTKNAADMVIADDNFASIVAAIEEGRGFYELMIKFIKYLISSNLAELLVVFFGALIGFMRSTEYLIFLPLHVLWINLVSDGLPAMALAFDPLHAGLMEKDPSVFRKPLLSFQDRLLLFCISALIAAVVIAVFLYGTQSSFAVGQSMAFTTLVMLEFARLNLVRSEYNVALFSNYWLIAAVSVSCIAQVLLLYVPTLQVLFRTVPLSLEHWLIMLISVVFTTGISRLLVAFFRQVAQPS